MISASPTIEEIQIARMSREFRGEVIAAGATILSDLAARLASLLYDHDLVLLGGGSWASFDCDPGPALYHDEYLTRSSARGQVDWSLAFDYVRADKLRIFVGPAQIDRHGNSNLSVIGSWDRPSVQLIGSRGLPDDLWNLSVIHYHVPSHTPTTLVEQVDFISSFGHGPTRERFRSSLGRPGVLVTDLGVFSWPEPGGRMQLESIHPGVEPERVRSATGFELDVPYPTPRTSLPTTAELHAIREVLDPLDLRSGRFNPDDERLADLLAGRVPLPIRKSRRS
jgi:glutaconate CoA-transferase subunit B